MNVYYQSHIKNYQKESETNSIELPQARKLIPQSLRLMLHFFVQNL